MSTASAGPAKKRGNSKPNVKRRGDTYTYYLYVTDHLGRRRQHSKGGFKTQREAEDARVIALAALRTGSYLKAEKQTLAEFLVKDWLPCQRPSCCLRWWPGESPRGWLVHGGLWGS